MAMCNDEGCNGTTYIHIYIVCLLLSQYARTQAPSRNAAKLPRSILTHTYMRARSRRKAAKLWSNIANIYTCLLIHIHTCWFYSHLCRKAAKLWSNIANILTCLLIHIHTCCFYSHFSNDLCRKAAKNEAKILRALEGKNGTLKLLRCFEHEVRTYIHTYIHTYRVLKIAVLIWTWGTYLRIYIHTYRVLKIDVLLWTWGTYVHTYIHTYI